MEAYEMEQTNEFTKNIRIKVFQSSVSVKLLKQKINS